MSLLHLAAASAFLLVAAAPPPDAHVRGTVTAVFRNRVDVRTAHGIVHLDTSRTRIATLLRASRRAITPYSYIGVATLGDGDTATAQEIVVYPPAWHGLTEGHYPWDLPGNATSMMTHGTVTPRRTMTNKAGALETDSQHRLRLRVTYRGGARTILVPDTVPIVTIHGASKAALTVGVHVFALAGTTGDVPTVAHSIFVGTFGLVPAM